MANSAPTLPFDRRTATYEQIRSDFWPILERYRDVEGAILPILHEAQGRYGWVSENTVRVISEFLRTTPPSVYAVVTYYHELSTESPADVNVVVCAGPACRVEGGPGLLAEIEEETGISVGDTRRDMKYSIKTSACLGICMHAPVAAFNHRVRGRLRAGDARQLLSAAVHYSDGGQA